MEAKEKPEEGTKDDCQIRPADGTNDSDDDGGDFYQQGHA